MGYSLLKTVVISTLLLLSSGCGPDVEPVFLIGEAAEKRMPRLPNGATDHVYFSDGGVFGGSIWHAYTCQSVEDCENSAKKLFGNLNLKPWDRKVPGEILNCPKPLSKHWQIVDVADGLYFQDVVRNNDYHFFLIDLHTNRCYVSRWSADVPQ